MDAESWRVFLGIPAAILASVGLPILVQKHRLEVRLKRLEIAKLESELPASTVRKLYAPPPGVIHSWFAKYYGYLQIALQLVAIGWA